MEASPNGSMCWFDPSREQLLLFELSSPELGLSSGVADALEMDDQEDQYDPDQVISIVVPDDGLPF